MKKLLMCFLVFGLTGCGSSGSMGSLNPFGRGGPKDPLKGVDTTGTATRPAQINDGSLLVPVLKTVEPESALRGVILRVTGLMPVQGYHDARLYPLNDGLPDEEGIVRFEFRAKPPAVPQGAGTERSREITAAAFISDGDLRFIRGFQIISAQSVVNLRN